jgi:GH18 family chitinase
MKILLSILILLFCESIYCQEYTIVETFSDHNLPQQLKVLDLQEEKTQKIVPQFHKSGDIYSSWTYSIDNNYAYFLGRINSNSNSCIEYRFEKISIKNLKFTIQTENITCDNSKPKYTYHIIKDILIVIKEDGKEISHIPVNELNKDNIWLK